MSGSDGSSERQTGVVSWTDEVETVLSGDLVVMFASVTPAGGVVMTPLTNFALQDRADGTVTLLSSLAAWRKLARIRRNPRVALAFHTRRHGYAHEPHYVLMQGTASFSTNVDRAWLESIEANWERFMGPRDRGLWGWWMKAYQWERIGIRVAVERVSTWSDLSCRTERVVHGVPTPVGLLASQKPPGKGTSPRVDIAQVVRRVSKLPDALLGWVDGDGFPMVVPVGGVRQTEHGIALDIPQGLVPGGGRRAGLTAHWFSKAALGQEQRLYTGWLEAEAGADEVSYAPHTQAGYRLPPSKLLYRVVIGGITRYGLRQARRSGFVSDIAST
ncbi:pyridoxamine 5'-phosphate oxidase family protein [Nocardia sp. NPDC051900]|uniref:pyridoxamine 5'-phosphate oxidase family protein n=1 Tax=Nocardia sp. NPDC051900 TaxID=3364326 RepID=UPI0037BC0F8D